MIEKCGKAKILGCTAGILGSFCLILAVCFINTIFCLSNGTTFHSLDGLFACNVETICGLESFTIAIPK